jgi:hypothetical protein
MTKTEALQALHDKTGGDLYDAEYEGGTWMVDCVESNESLRDFEAATFEFAERSFMKTGRICGLTFISFDRVQPRKGDARRSMTVIDLGEVRVVLDCETNRHFEIDQPI